MIMYEEIKVNDTLNQNLWNEDNTLKEEVKERLLDIVDNFLDMLKEDNIDIDVVDVRFLGSNANYNYTDKSDIDLHIVADFSSLPCEQNVMPQLYNAYKVIFNSKFDIKINGFDVEIYVEDVNSPAKSNGVYSLYTGWIKEPVKSDIPNIDWEEFERQFDEWEDRYFDIMDEYTSNELEENLLNHLDTDILNIIKDNKEPEDYLNGGTIKCSNSAGYNLLKAYNDKDTKDIKLYVGGLSPEENVKPEKIIIHMWIEVDGKTYATNEDNYYRIPNEYLQIDKSKDLYSQVHNFLNKDGLKEDLSQEVDSEGNPLSNEQVEFFKNSKVRDSQGRLLVVYHGTDAESFTNFYNDSCIFTTDNKSVATYFSKGFNKDTNRRTLSLYLNIENPLYLNNKGKDWNNVVVPQTLKQYFNDNTTTIDELCYAVKYFNNYDGIIINNIKEGNGIIVSDYISFNPNQIKSIDNKNPSNSNNINEDYKWINFN